MTLRTCPPDVDVMKHPGNVTAAALPCHLGAKGKNSESSLAKLPVETSFAVLGLHSEPLPGVADSSKCRRDLLWADAMPVVLDYDLGDRLKDVVAPQAHGHRLGLSVDGVPNQLHHRTQGISLVGESANVIVPSL